MPSPSFVLVDVPVVAKLSVLIGFDVLSLLSVFLVVLVGDGLALDSNPFPSLCGWVVLVLAVFLFHPPLAAFLLIPCGLL